MRKRFIIMVTVFISLMTGTAFAEDISFDAFAKDYAVSLSAGRTYFLDSDFKDFWELESSYDGFALAVERKFGKNFGLELSGGTSHYHSRKDGIITSGDRLTADIMMYHASVSPKIYLRTGQRSVLYFGGGADYYNAEIDLQYRRSIFTEGYNEKFEAIGLHAFVGSEFIFFRKKGVTGDIDAPVSLFLEYRYLTVNIDEADKDFIDDVNTIAGTSEDSHNLNVGGHTGIIGIRWRF